MIKGNLAVTGLISMDNPSPGLAIVKSIKESGQFKGKFIGLAFDVLSTGVFAHGLLDEVYLIPPPADGEGPLLERLKEIVQKTRIDTIIPTLDSETVIYARAKEKLRTMGIRLLIPEERQIKTRAKIALPEFAQRHGFNIPKTITITSKGQLQPVISDLGLPIVLKGPFLDCHIASNEEEAEVFFDRLVDSWGFPLLAQEHVVGEEYNIAALTDGERELIGAVVMKKIGITGKGKAWAGVTVHDQDFLNLGRKILAKLEWTGPIELEFLKGAFSRKFYLVEVNSRFPSWIYLAAKAGQNLPLATFQIAMGKRVKPMPPYQTGVMFYRSAQEYVVNFDLLKKIAIHGEIVYR